MKIAPRRFRQSCGLKRRQASANGAKRSRANAQRVKPPLSSGASFILFQDDVERLGLGAPFHLELKRNGPRGFQFLGKKNDACLGFFGEKLDGLEKPLFLKNAGCHDTFKNLATKGFSNVRKKLFSAVSSRFRENKTIEIQSPLIKRRGKKRKTPLNPKYFKLGIFHRKKEMTHSSLAVPEISVIAALGIPQESVLEGRRSLESLPSFQRWVPLNSEILAVDTAPMGLPVRFSQHARINARNSKLLVRANVDGL